MNIPTSPMMCDEDIKFIENYLTSEDIFLEWGSGGSTMYFPSKVKKYYSIEHSVAWSNALYFNIPPNVEYYQVSPNLPLSDPFTLYDEIKDYVNKVDDLNVEIFNKVFIDGRGRAFCAVKILPYLDKNSIVFIHDFWSRECRGYFEVFKYYDIVDYTTSDEGLIALKKK